MNNRKIMIIVIVIILFIVNLSGCMYHNKNRLRELTTEEKLEDFRYIYDILEKNYPHFYESDSMNEYDWLEYKDDFEFKIKNTDNNIQFFYELSSILDRFNNSHTDVVDPDFYYLVASGYKNSKKQKDEDYTKFKPWIDTWLSAEKKYEGWYELLKGEFNKKSKEISTSVNEENIVTKIIEDEKIAYLKIKSFMTDSQKEILNFLEEVKGYPYLIIDIMDNEGGDDSYWNDMAFALVNEDTKMENHFLVRGDKYSMKFLDSELFSEFTIENIEDYINYDKLDKKIRDNFKYHIFKEYDITSEHSIGFQGDIYLLINNNTFSTSENLIDFCKQTKTATVVGEPTEGGLGFNPLYVSLPNSGLIVRFEGGLVLNKDGNSESMGIKPDIEIERTLGVKYNEKVLQETIRIIHSIEE